MDATSKPIGKSDDPSKEFIIKCLKGDKTYGFDIDSVYFLYNEKIKQYYIFEYLKCENDHLTPYTSNPKYYPYNWRKFHSLFQLAKHLNAKLLLVNYSDGYKQIKQDNKVILQELPNKEKYINEVKIFYVSNINYKALQKYESLPDKEKQKTLEYLEYEKVEYLTFDEFSNKLRELNKICGNNKINWKLLIDE